MSALRKAFARTYSREIDSTAPYYSFLSGFTGFAYKYKKDTKSKQIVKGWDKSKFNNGEQVLLAPFRIGKNVAKLGTELFWNYGADVTKQFSGYLARRAADVVDSNIKTIAWDFASAAVGMLSIAVGAVEWVGKSITSPMAALQETIAYNKNRRLGLGYAIIGARALFSLAAYATIGMIAAPAVATWALAGSFTAPVMAGLITATNWIGSLPLISAVGAFVASNITTAAAYFGVGIAEGLASTAAIAATAMVAVPVLAGVRTLLKPSDKGTVARQSVSAPVPPAGPIAAAASLVGGGSTSTSTASNDKHHHHVPASSSTSSSSSSSEKHHHHTPSSTSTVLAATSAAPAVAAPVVIKPSPVLAAAVPAVSAVPFVTLSDVSATVSDTAAVDPSVGTVADKVQVTEAKPAADAASAAVLASTTVFAAPAASAVPAGVTAAVDADEPKSLKVG